ncbi:hypothetical protein Z951_34705 [Streptomyces sp. PRh5]|uniref:ATP-binding protein n=1 Tax=Streptomyces sp. PRh5 TaxID=1158056 RepID=UPI000445EB60|nr:ATP-binding protein [Streptomyces sp. PRh5]EXU63697.1 hypothetical protein Z951_34705 [Streptomyces sp. PRh5]
MVNRIGSSERPGGGRGACDRFREARKKAFFGRKEELALLRSVFCDEDRPFSVFWIHGPGGVGKSTLLQHFADLAREEGTPCRLLDARRLGPVSSLSEALGSDTWPDGIRLLLIDTAEELRPELVQLHEWFVKSAPEGALLVMASRQCPPVKWVTDSAWWGRVHTVHLDNLGPDDAAEVLRHRNVPERDVPQVLRFTHGHPLALVLTAGAVSARSDTSRPWAAEESPDVSAELVRQFVQDVTPLHHIPSELQRGALEILATARVTTERELRACTSAAFHAHSQELFEWLRGLSFVRAYRDGLVPHSTAREALMANLRWRDASRYERVVRGLHQHITARLLTMNHVCGRREACDLLYLGRATGVLRTPFPYDVVFGTNAAPNDHVAAMSLIEHDEGPQAVRLAEDWWRAQPQAFTIFRGPRRNVEALLVTVRVTSNAVAVPEDPVVGAALDWTMAHAPLRPGEHLLVTRWTLVHDQREQDWASADFSIAGAMLSRWVCPPGPAVSYTCLREGEPWSPYLTIQDHQRLELVEDVASKRRVPYVHDWRTDPPTVVLARLAEQQLHPAQAEADVGFADPEVMLARTEFTEAVKEAFRNLHRRDVLVGSALLRSRLVPAHGGADGVRRLLMDVVAMTARSPLDAEAAHVLRVSFLEGARSQQAAAHRLGLSFSTYRRRLAAALQLMADQLWEWECDRARSPRPSREPGHGPHPYHP